MTSVPGQRLRLSQGLGVDEWRLRAAPAADAAVLGHAELGDVLLVLALADESSDWLRVRVEATELEGWSLSRLEGQPCFEPADLGACWAVLICGGTRGSYYGTPKRPWRDLGGELSLLQTLGSVYESLEAELGQERVIVIAGLETARSWLQSMASKGYSEPSNPDHIVASKAYYGGDMELSKRKWARRLEILNQACAKLIARGGADYDGIHVNPTTVLRVLAGTSTDGGRGRVLPRSGVASCFLYVTTHGSAHPISVNVRTSAGGQEAPVPIVDEAESEGSTSMDANEWFWIMPHRAEDPSAYGFVRLAGYTVDPDADPACDHLHLPLYVVYWQQIFQVLNSMRTWDPGRHIVAFYQFCLAGGFLNFLQREAIREHWGVDRWPVSMVASAAANQNSLAATLTEIFLQQLRQALDAGVSVRLGDLLDQLEVCYWQQHEQVRRMNRSLPAHMRIGEISIYHTPDGGMRDLAVRDVFSNLAASAPTDGRGHLLAPTNQASSEDGSPIAAGTGVACAADAASRRALVETIMAMGFREDAVVCALEVANDIPDLAVDLLLSAS